VDSPVPPAKIVLELPDYRCDIKEYACTGTATQRGDDIKVLLVARFHLYRITFDSMGLPRWLLDQLPKLLVDPRPMLKKSRTAKRTSGRCTLHGIPDISYDLSCPGNIFFWKPSADPRVGSKVVNHRADIP